MGVIGTFCQHCGVAVQHDHYVPVPGTDHLKIYRGSSENGGHTWASDEHPFQFGPEHQWLKAAVTVPFLEGQTVLHGPIEDGMLEDVFVADGEDEARAFHEYCWRALGSPTSVAPKNEPRPSWAIAERYHEQLFDFHRFVKDGHGWMLVDPIGDSDDARRNAERIG